MHEIHNMPYRSIKLFNNGGIVMYIIQYNAFCRRYWMHQPSYNKDTIWVHLLLEEGLILQLIFLSSSFIKSLASSNKSFPAELCGIINRMCNYTPHLTNHEILEVIVYPEILQTYMCHFYVLGILFCLFHCYQICTTISNSHWVTYNSNFTMKTEIFLQVCWISKTVHTKNQT